MTQSQYSGKKPIFYWEKYVNKNVPISEQKPEGARDSYWCRFVEEDNLLFISFKACLDEDFTGFRSEVMKILKDNRNSVKSIIFDLRDNGGGDSVYLESLIDLIKTTDKKSTIKTYAFINSGTFSSGALGAVNLADRINTTVIGSNTGVTKFSYGDFIEVKLQNLESILTYSSKTFNYETRVAKKDTLELFRDTEDGKVTLGPEIYIEESFDDYKNGIDKCYEYVVNQ